MKNFLEYLFLLPLRLVVLMLPFRAVQIAGKLLGTFIFYVIPIRKTLTLSNLRHAFPEKSEREIQSIALASFQNLFTTYFEIFWFPRMTEKKLRELVSISNVGLVTELLKQHKGAIILGGHFGNWELSALSFGVISRQPILIIVQKQRNTYIDEIMNDFRTKFGNDVVVMEQAPREILKRLRLNRPVALLADQSGPEEGVFVDYFGRPTSTHQGPAIFHLRTGAPMMMAFIVRQPNGKFLGMFEQVSLDDLGTTEEDKIRTVTERHVQMLEKYARLHPGHWLWMHKRWKHTEKYLQRRAEAVHS